MDYNFLRFINTSPYFVIYTAHTSFFMTGKEASFGHLHNGMFAFTRRATLFPLLLIIVFILFTLIIQCIIKRRFQMFQRLRIWILLFVHQITLFLSLCFLSHQHT